jgi:hypothetical protein
MLAYKVDIMLLLRLELIYLSKNQLRTVKGYY